MNYLLMIVTGHTKHKVISGPNYLQSLKYVFCLAHDHEAIHDLSLSSNSNARSIVNIIDEMTKLFKIIYLTSLCRVNLAL